MDNKFLKPELNKLFNPVDWFNFFGDFASIFDNDKKCLAYCDTSATYLTDGEYTKTPTFELNALGNVVVKKSNPYDLAIGLTISKFMLLSVVKFKSDNSKAETYVLFSLMEREIPYIRVGTDYFNVCVKKNRYDVNQTILKTWDKVTINDDHGKGLFNYIPKYKDFTIVPNNKTFIPVEGECYNLYSQFSHTAVSQTVEVKDIQTTVQLINHIFGDQSKLGLKYLQILYLYPTQILPVLALVSTERETGKTTFLNYLQMIFGENSTLINPQDLTSSFNDAYATKNIIMIDETVIDKAHTIEKLKSIATAKTMSVSQKFVSHYSVPFFGKVIICTNKETDFMKIDEDEIRFWIRKINSISGPKNTNIETDLRNEIPLFLKFLEQLPAPDFSRSRMVFTKDEIETDSLTIIKDESKSGLRKDIEEFICDLFYNSTFDEFEAAPIDVKERFFAHNNQLSPHYIKKVLTTEMKLEAQTMKRYTPFNNAETPFKKSGTPFLFKRLDFTKDKIEVNDEPF